MEDQKNLLKNGSILQRRFVLNAVYILLIFQDIGHYSYSCPKNQLGSRDPPSKPEKKKGRREVSDGNTCLIYR